ncbi:MAG: nucleotidyltransferase family protein [Rhodomicrobium sp.]|nr:nucleotidyltransferase family protein [Rhodomicrobium sp.]
MQPPPSFATLAAIVLAAGFSRRMGLEDKLLKLLNGKPVLSHSLDRIETIDFGQVVVVAGANCDHIAKLLPASVTMIRNERASDGMGSSIAAGASALGRSVRGAFIVLGDMPFVERSDYEKIAAAFHDFEETAICVPAAAGRRGHPVLFGRSHFPALKRLSGDRGAQALFAAPQTLVREVEACSGGVLIDIDDAAAFAEAERRFGKAAPGRSS